MRSRRAIWLAVALAVVVSACSPEPAPTTAPASPSPSPVRSTPTAEVIPSGGIAIDMDLLGVLPAVVDGIALQPSPATAAEIAADPALGRDVQALAVALLVGPGSSAGDDLAVASVVRLKAGVLDDAFHRAWRESYDVAACEQAGGLIGSAETVIGGRAVHVGTCAGGAHTYHLRLDEDDLLLSITSVGEGRLGERLVEAIGS